MSDTSAGYPVTDSDRNWLATELRNMQDRIDRHSLYVQSQVATAGGLVPLRPTIGEAFTIPRTTGTISQNDDGAIEFDGISQLYVPDLFTPGYRMHRLVWEISTTDLILLISRFTDRAGNFYTETTSDNTVNTFFKTGAIVLQAGGVGVNYSILGRCAATPTIPSFIVTDFMSAAEPRAKKWATRSVDSDAAVMQGGGVRPVDTVYSGLRFSITTGTMSGYLKVFGLKA